VTSEITLLAAALPGWTISAEVDSTGYVRAVARDERGSRATVTVRGIWSTDLGSAWNSLVSTLLLHSRLLSEKEIAALDSLVSRAAGAA